MDDSGKQLCDERHKRIDARLEEAEKCIKDLSEDIETGVYTAEFSTDETAKKLADMQAEIEKLKATKKT